MVIPKPTVINRFREVRPRVDVLGNEPGSVLVLGHPPTSVHDTICFTYDGLPNLGAVRIDVLMLTLNSGTTSLCMYAETEHANPGDHDEEFNNLLTPGSGGQPRTLEYPTVRGWIKPGQSRTSVSLRANSKLLAS
jgi:hypothetical protein